MNNRKCFVKYWTVPLTTLNFKCFSSSDPSYFSQLSFPSLLLPPLPHPFLPSSLWVFLSCSSPFRPQVSWTASSLTEWTLCWLLGDLIRHQHGDKALTVSQTPPTPTLLQNSPEGEGGVSGGDMHECCLLQDKGWSENRINEWSFFPELVPKMCSGSSSSLTIYSSLFVLLLESHDDNLAWKLETGADK